MINYSFKSWASIPALLASVSIATFSPFSSFAMDKESSSVPSIRVKPDTFVLVEDIFERPHNHFVVTQKIIETAFKDMGCTTLTKSYFVEAKDFDYPFIIVETRVSFKKKDGQTTELQYDYDLISDKNPNDLIPTYLTFTGDTRHAFQQYLITIGRAPENLIVNRSI